MVTRKINYCESTTGTDLREGRGNADNDGGKVIAGVGLMLE